MTLLFIINLFAPATAFEDQWTRPFRDDRMVPKLSILEKPMPSMEFCEKFVAKIAKGKTGLVYCIQVGSGWTP
jgi:hypothetical protein